MRTNDGYVLLVLPSYCLSCCWFSTSISTNIVALEAGQSKRGNLNLMEFGCAMTMQPVVATVVLKIGSTGLHCDGCMNRIRSKLFKIKGVEQVRMDMGKNQVTVTGTMDAKALPEKLRKKLRRPVDVVAPGKEKDGKQEGGGKDVKGGGGGGGGNDAATKALTAELEAWKAAFFDQQPLLNAELMLSDENPSACAVM